MMMMMHEEQQRYLIDGAGNEARDLVLEHVREGGGEGWSSLDGFKSRFIVREEEGEDDNASG